MIKVFYVFLFFAALSLTSCRTYSTRGEFTQTFAARYIPERFVFLDEAEKVDERGPSYRLVGAYSNADDLGRWGIVWAEYSKDYKGEWHRSRHVDTPVKYAEELEEAGRIADEILADYLQE